MGVDLEAVLCAPCHATLPRLAPGRCRLCQEAEPAPGREGCAPCLAAGSPLRACLAASPYVGEIAGWIQRFKYPRPGLLGLDPAAAALVGVLVREAARGAPESPDLVVPIPLHPARLRERGFNPAAELARSVCRGRGRILAPRLLERVRDTPSQTGLDRRQRARNVAGAFRLRRARRLPRLVWLVDDVVTTGSTLREAARTLRRAGARSVVALCAARTPAVA